MAIENTYLLGKNITLGCGFDLQAKAPLDSRQTVPAFAGLQALIDNNAAYEGMIVYDEETKKTYQAQLVDGALAFREFGINEAELKDLIASETTAAMEFKGAATALPENPAKGDMYKVAASFEVAGETAKVGDSIVYNGEEWFLIPSGDDIEDTWRPVTDVDNDATLTFAAGDKLDVAVAANGTVTYSHEAIDAPVNQNSDEDEPTRTYITQLIADNHGHIIGFKTATETVEDTNTTYEFEGLPVEEGEPAPSSVYFQVKSSDADAAEVIYLDAYNKNEANAELAKKVDKESYEADKATFAIAETVNAALDLKANAADVVDNGTFEEFKEANTQAIEDNADAIDALEEYVGTIPNVPDADGNNKYADLDVIGYINKKAQETLAAASGNSSETAASVKQQLDDYIGDNDKRVKDAEDAISALDDRLKAEEEKVDNDTTYTFENGTEGTFKVTAKGGEAQTVDTGAKAYADAEIKKVSDALQSLQELTSDNFDSNNTRIDLLETASATHATKDELAGVNAKFANYNDKITQSGIDVVQDTRIKKIEDDYLKAADIADLASKTSVQDVADDLAEYIESNDAAVADRYTKAEADDKFLAKADHVPYDDTAVRGLIKDNADAIDAIEADYLKAADRTVLANAIAGKADKSVVDAMYTNDQIDGFLNGKVDKTAYDEDKATFALKTDLNAYRTSADQDEIDQDFEDRIAELEAIDHDKLAEDAAASAVATVLDGAPAKFDTLKEIAAWIAEADTAEDAASLVTRVSALESAKDDYKDADAELKEELEGKIDAINNHSHTFVESELNEIKTGDVAKWNAEIGAKELAASKTTTAEVKAQIEAYEYATEADLTLAEDRIAALEGVKDDYKTADATLKAELQAEIDADVKALADGQVKTNTEAIAANAEEIAKKANSADVYAKSETYTKSEIEALLTWGSF